MGPDDQASPEVEVSILIPIYNEEAILEESVRDIIGGADPLGISYELVLCENGSKDRTVEIGERLCEEFPQLRLLRCPVPDYGEALILGIREAHGRHIVCFEIDFYDVHFIEQAHVLLKRYDAVIGSKRAVGSRDRRPFIRRLITWGFNSFLRIVFTASRRSAPSPCARWWTSARPAATCSPPSWSCGSSGLACGAASCPSRSRRSARPPSTSFDACPAR